jgi:antirestriction protein ArdC
MTKIIKSTDRTEIEQTALHNAKNGQSFMNYLPIIQGFVEMGIPADEIEPRVNVFTFNAWKALGRTVSKGQHGIKVVTWVPMTKKVEDGTEESFRRPKSTTVFHISQTEEIKK